MRRSPRHSPIRLPLVLVCLAFGCGKEATREDFSDLDFSAPVYAELPDTAPLADQLDAATAKVEKELLEEQERFFLKRPEDLRRMYVGPEGEPLVDSSALDQVVEMMASAAPVRLKILCDRVSLLAALPEGGAPEPPVQTRVHILGETVPAEASYSPTTDRPVFRVRTTYRYEVQGGPNFSPSQQVAIQKRLFYVKDENGSWRRARVEEQRLGSTRPPR